MRKTYTYKLQGDGSDSWTVTEINQFDEIVSVYMVYQDPTQEVGTALKAVMNASAEELIEIKKILGI
jgi:hypothetical protein